MALCQNISGTVKEEDKLTQNVSGVLKTLVSFKQSVNGILKELLSKKLITSGTLIVGWQAVGNASIASQTGETVTATLMHTSTNISAACPSRIFSGSFYAEAGTEFTFSHGGMSPSGPLGAYLIDEDGNVVSSASGAGSKLTVTTSGTYSLIIAGAGMVGSQTGTSIGYTTITNATFTFTGGVVYLGNSSLYFIMWHALAGSSVSHQVGETVKGSISASSISGAYEVHSIYSTTFYLEAGQTISFTGTISPSGPFYAYLVDANGSATEIGTSGASLQVSVTGYYHLALAGTGVKGSSSGAGTVAGTFSATFSVT